MIQLPKPYSTKEKITVEVFFCTVIISVVCITKKLIARAREKARIREIEQLLQERSKT